MSGTARRSLIIGIVIILAAAAAAAGWQAIRASREALFVSPAELEFGDVRIGKRASAFLIATNRHSERPLAVKLEAEPPFQPDVPELVLEPGASQTLSFTFQPETAGEIRATAVLSSEAGSVRVALHGRAHGVPNARVEPAALEFGDVSVGAKADSVVLVENRGVSDLEIENLRTTGAYQASLSSMRIAPGESAQLTVQFAPPRARTWSSQLVLSTNDPVRREITIPLMGRGVEGVANPNIEVDRDAVDFGAVPVGTTRRSYVTIRNTGADPLTVSSLLLPRPFRTPSRSRVIAPGGELRLPIWFTPSSEAQYEGALSIHSNDPDGDSISVALAGLGAARGTGLASAAGGATSAGAGSAAALGRTAGGASGAPGGAADAAADPTAPIDPSQPPAQAPAIDVLEGSEVQLGSYPALLEDQDLGHMVLDRTNGVVSLEDVQLPTVYAALSEYFTFSPSSGFGTVNELGDVDVVLPVELYDRWGNPGGTVLTLTTGIATTVVEGQQISIAGQPVGPDGRAKLVGLATFDTGPLRGQPVKVVINVQVQGGE